MTFMRRELLEAMQKVITTAPEAYAFVYGGKKYPHIKGFVYFFPLWGGTVVPVSYTHLDVYKRQSLGLPPNSLDTESSIKQGCKYFASLLSS